MKDIITTTIAAVGSIIVAIIGYWKYKSKKVKQKVSGRKLKYHSIHDRLEDFKQYVKYELNASTDGREELIEDFLINMFDIYQEKFKELARIVDKQDLSDEELESINLEKLRDGIKSRSTYFYCDKYTAEERESLDLLVKKYHSRRSNRIEYFKSDIKKVIRSKYYNDQVTMQALIFDKYIGEFSHILTWFEDIIDEINGDFQDLKFSGEYIDGDDLDD